jgi:asparagine synthase (glutamine-hydrolysing)
MCGITGGIWIDPAKAIDEPQLARMTDVLRHRGPDDRGLYRSDYHLRPPYEAMPGVALGHRRLSIIDLACGQQPLSNEDGTVWIVFNGEIYNYLDLRRRLEGSGHKFRTESDTESIVHLYEDEGPAGFAHLNGMFALAIWDMRQRKLILARDRIGKKPLVYRYEAGRLLFASELKSLLEVDGIPRELDHAAVDEYLTYQYVSHPNCILKGFRKLPPGHYAEYVDDRLAVKPFWQPDFAFERHISQSDAETSVRELFDSAVKMRMRSDVPLGAFLSGGIDSSLIVALMQRHASEPVKTFTISFPEREYDESPFAQQVAEHLKTEHRALQVTPDAADVLPKLIWHYDEPFADSSAIPTWYLSQLTREHVTVALSGDGGDELFAGYPRYRAVALAQSFDRLPPLRSLLASPWMQRLPAPARQKSKLRQFRRFCEALAMPAQRRYLDWISIFNEARRADLYSDEFVAQLPDSDPASFLDRAWRRAGSRDAVTAASLADVTTYLPGDLMTKVDVASMAHSLEVRCPFLDYRLVEFAAALPARLKYRRGEGKRLLRSAFGDLLPRSIWKRPKMGFGVPLEHWFRGKLRSLLADTLLDPAAKTRALFRPEAVESLLAEHQQHRFNHSARLWALLVLELWMQEWMPSRSAIAQASASV